MFVSLEVFQTFVFTCFSDVTSCWMEALFCIQCFIDTALVVTDVTFQPCDFMTDCEWIICLKSKNFRAWSEASESVETQ